MGEDPWVVQVLRFGYIIPFHSPPPLSSTPIPLPSYTPSSIRVMALAAAVKDLLSKGAIEPSSSGPGFYSLLFVTPKVTGGRRLVIDLLFLNWFVRLSHFRMETAQSVLQSLRSGDWLISLDLQDAYLKCLSTLSLGNICASVSICGFQKYRRLLANMRLTYRGKVARFSE